jgi:hypothetical protein
LEITSGLYVNLEVKNEEAGAGRSEKLGIIRTLQTARSFEAESHLKEVKSGAELLMSIIKVYR